MVGCLAGIVSGFEHFGHCLPSFQIRDSNQFSAVLLSGNFLKSAINVMPFLKFLPGALLIQSINYLYIYSLLKYIIPLILAIDFISFGMSLHSSSESMLSVSL